MVKNIPLFKVFMADTAGAEVAKVLNSGYIGQGPKVEEFEKVLTNYFRNDRIVTTNSATSAEHLALNLLRRPAFNNWPGMQPGDEVLATALTCTASNWPIILEGYNIKWVDVDNSLNMDLDDLARKITPKTKAIMLVFWGGMPVDMNKLSQIQQRAFDMYGFKPAVIIDGAHSLGSKYMGQHICNLGHITTYSFQAIKHITSVDGGALVVPHESLHRRAKLLRWYGIDREGNRKDFRCEADIEEIGTKWHMNDVCATVGIENFKHVERITKIFQDNAAYYNEELQQSPVRLIPQTVGATSASWLYTIRVDKRDDFMAAMKDRGIITSRVHERNDLHTATRQWRSQLPKVDEVVKDMICIPNGWWVTPEDREYIVESIRKGW